MSAKFPGFVQPDQTSPGPAVLADSLAGYTVRTDDLMAEERCLYHTSWIIGDQPRPLNVRGGQRFIDVPYTGQTNDAGMLAWIREADYFPADDQGPVRHSLPRRRGSLWAGIRKRDPNSGAIASPS
jgi:hypothetical protein